MNLLRPKRGLLAATLLRCRAAHLLPASSIILAGLLASNSAVAQGNGVLTGRIVDASTKKPLAEVVVTATSPALQGEQIVVTDGSGQYRIPNLPPGDYTLRLDRDTYRPYGRGGISMRSSSTIQVNAELLPEQVTLKADEIVVVGKAPTVDVGSSSTGVSMNQEFTSHLPLTSGTATRSFEGLATVAPGAQADNFGVSVNGTTSPENSFVIDGVGVNNPAFGTLGTPLSVEFVKEFNVISGGYMPEYGRATGGIFDVVTKSGSNEFHGSVFFNITPGALEGGRTQVRRNGDTITTNPSLGSLRDFGADIGGPVLKDRLWFYGGVQAAFTRNQVTRTLNELDLDPLTGLGKKDADTGFTLVKPIPNTTKTYVADDRTIQYIGKLTLLLNQDHNISVSVYGTPTTSGGNGTLRNPAPANITGPYSIFAAHSIQNSNDISLKYSGAFNNKHQLLDFTLGWHHQRAALLPNDDSPLGGKDPNTTAGKPLVQYIRTSPDRHSISDFEPVPAGYCEPFDVHGDKADPAKVTKTITPCPLRTYSIGGPGLMSDAAIDSYQAKLVGTSLFSLAGHHVVKAGIDIGLTSYLNRKAITGGVILQEDPGGGSFRESFHYGFLSGPDQAEELGIVQSHTNSTTVGGFIQDSWSIMDKVTLNAGVRYDTQLIYGADGKLGLTLPNQWSPRVGAIYDFTQQGRSKIFVNYARYYEGVPLDASDRGFPGEVQSQATHLAKSEDNPDGCDPRTNPSSAACRTDKSQLDALGTTNDPNHLLGRVGGDRVPVDPDISAQSSDEFVAGGEYEIFPNGRLGLTYTHRYINRVIEDMSRDEANTYFLGNPGYGIAKDFPKPVRDYDALSISFQKAFANTWLAQASYTVSMLRGNYSGLFRPETNQLDPNITSDFDLRSLLPNRLGPLPGDSTHQIKLYGSKDFTLPGDMNILVGAAFRTRSGIPLNYLGRHIVYGANEVFVLPRGSAGRGDWIHNFDLKLGYSIKLGKASTLGLTVDIANLFNFQAATVRDPTYTNTRVLPIPDGTVKDLADLKTGSPGKLQHPDGSPFKPETDLNPNFKNPTAYQDPRQFRFGAKVTF